MSSERSRAISISLRRERFVWSWIRRTLEQQRVLQSLRTPATASKCAARSNRRPIAHRPGARVLRPAQVGNLPLRAAGLAPLVFGGGGARRRDAPLRAAAPGARRGRHVQGGARGDARGDRRGDAALHLLGGRQPRHPRLGAHPRADALPRARQLAARRARAAAERSDRDDAARRVVARGADFAPARPARRRPAPRLGRDDDRASRGRARVTGGGGGDGPPPPSPRRRRRRRRTAPSARRSSRSAATRSKGSNID